MSELEKHFGPWVVRHRSWLTGLCFVVALVAGGGVSRLAVNNDMRVFFSERNPQLKALEALENVYTRDDNVMFILAPDGGDVFTAQTLSAIETLTRRAWQLPFSSRVDSLTNFQHSRASGDDLQVGDLVEAGAELDPPGLARVREIALHEPLLAGRLVSHRGHVTAVNVTIIMPGQGHQEVTQVAVAARALADEFRQLYPEIDFHLAGGVIADAVFGEAAERDAVSLVPVMCVVLILVVAALLRSLWGTLAALLVILFATLTGMGLAGWFGIELTAASVSAPVIILTLAVADSVHILETVFQQMREGVSRYDAIHESVRVNLNAVFLTSVTTAIGFLSMNFSDAPPLRDLGNIVAMGVMAAFFYSVVLLPGLLSLLPLRPPAARPESARPPCDAWARLSVAHAGPVLWTTLGLVVLVGSGTVLNELDDDFIKYFGKRFEIRRATDFMEEHLTGFNVIEYSLNSGDANGIADPAYLADVEAFANWYRAQPAVAHVAAVTDLFKRLNMNMHEDDERWYRLPDDRALASQYLLLYEMSLPFGLDLTNRINLDKSASRLSVLLRDVTAREIRETDERARAWLNDNAPALLTYGTGLSVIWAHISKRNIRQMLTASVAALLLISLLLVLAFRSWWAGAISLVPNLVPALSAFGLWGIFVGQVGLALSVIVSMTLGIVVDDTVHFLSRYLRARRERGLSPEASVHRAFNTVGTALWVTTAALVAGFSVLVISPYKMTADMGLMSAMTIALALVLDFLLLPALLLKTDSAPRGTPESSRNGHPGVDPRGL